MWLVIFFKDTLEKIVKKNYLIFYRKLWGKINKTKNINNNINHLRIIFKKILKGINIILI